MIIVDIETSGLSPTENGILSLGAVQFQSGDEFYEECRLTEGREISTEALTINGFTREQCFDKSKQTDVKLLKNFIQWCTNRGDLILCGTNLGSFDIQFLKEINKRSLDKWIFGHRYVDIHSIGYFCLGASYGSDELRAQLGLPPEAKPHNALTGAKCAMETFEKLFET